jgi:ParB/RepB/Spo0J family partition protein
MPKSRRAFLPIGQIDLGKRFREDYGNLDELSASIKEFDELIQSVVVRETETPDKYLLMAGGRRYRACLAAGETEIKADIWPKGLTELEYRKIELAENVKRKDLTWVEEVTLTQEINRLVQQELGIAATQNDVAELLGKDRSAVSKDLQLAIDMESLPELRESKTKKEALIKANAVKERIVKAEIAKRITDRLKVNNETEHEQLINSFIVGDCTKILPTFKDESFDLIELDPPYGIGFDTQHTGSINHTLTEYSDLTNLEEHEALMKTVLAECYRLLSDRGWIYMWHSVWYSYAVTAYKLLEEAGFITAKAPVIWIKPATSVSHNHNPDSAFTVNYDMFVYARKSKKALLNVRGPSSTRFYTPPIRSIRIHPNEKPILLTEMLLREFCPSGARVLSPFAGSGNVLFAAYNNKMSAVGIDLKKEYKEAFVVRASDWKYGDRPDNSKAIEILETLKEDKHV